ncbi:MAG TPA: hypothetical protein ENJ95_12450 [Bacteroidetes bacterium]|nr:hypothetical protein [Bacteroidota bacterium]
MSNKLYTCFALIFLSAITFCSAEERIPFRMEGNLLLIKATINGQTGEFILDTGAPDLILNQAHCEGVRIPWAQTMIVDFHGVASEARHFAINGFSIGGLSIKKQHALSVDLSSVEKAKNIHLLGIIGYTVLKDLQLLFDFDRQELTIAPSGKKETSILADGLPLAVFDLRFSGHVPFLIAHFGKKKFRFGIDTGAEVNILGNRAVKCVGAGFDEIKKLRVKGITKNHKAARSGVLRGLVIDGQFMEPMAFTAISIHPLNENLTVGLDGILGMPFLKKGKVALDYRKKRMWIWESDGRLVEESPGEEVEVLLEGQ